MKTTELARIADILPPPPPVSPASAIELYLVLATGLIVIVFWLWYSHSTSRQLRQLRQQYTQQKIDHRQLAFRLDQLLRQRLQLPRISPALTPAHRDADAWYKFAVALHAARFSREAMNDEILFALLDKTDDWLRQQKS